MRSIAAFLAFLTTLVPLGAVAQGPPVTVTVNGAPVSFDQPPVERAGRVYVPLRGVFERLGATVVYQAGKINATRAATTVSLDVGSNTAIVNGTQMDLDSPPFLIGARTLVPLRFVAQALGANVSYDGTTRTVAIAQPTPAPVVATPVPQPRNQLVRIEPPPNGTVRGLRPQISATFARPIDANAVRILLDGRDVTAAAYVSNRAFSFEPQYDLPFGVHEVAVRAPALAQTWTFTNVAEPHPNFLRGLSPPNGSAVPPAFTVQGYTQPGSRVVIVAAARAPIGFGEVNESTATTTVLADARGHFAGSVMVLEMGAGVVDVRVESRAPDGGIAVATLRLRPARP